MSNGMSGSDRNMSLKQQGVGLSEMKIDHKSINRMVSEINDMLYETQSMVNNIGDKINGPRVEQTRDCNSVDPLCNNDPSQITISTELSWMITKLHRMYDDLNYINRQL